MGTRLESDTELDAAAPSAADGHNTTQGKTTRSLRGCSEQLISIKGLQMVIENTSCTAALSNFAIQYNYACASIATAVMLSADGPEGPSYPQPEWAKKWMLSLVFVGSVVGMLVMGVLGDLFGIRKALIVTNSLTVAGALSSALLSWGDSETVWAVIAASRFVLGVGVGGNYPLSAAKASAAVPLQEAISRAAAAFFWQGPGSVAPYFVGLILLWLPRFSHTVSLQFRLLMGLGAVPALASVRSAMKEQDRGAGSGRSLETLKESLNNRSNLMALVGTAGTWFLFDVAFYGTVIFSPSILRAVFGHDESLTGLCFHALSIGILAITGTGLGVIMLPVYGARTLCIWGLAFASLLFASFAWLVHVKPEANGTLFAFLCALYVILYMGPNIATYLLPIVAFPEDVRSSFHGLSAAAAKLGAMAGTILFPEIDEQFGVKGVMSLQAIACLAGCLLCLALVKPTEDEDASMDSCIEKATEKPWQA